VDLDFSSFDPSRALEAILHCDARQITTRTAKSLPAYLALEAMAQTCGLHLRQRHDFRVQAYLVSMTDLPYVPGFGVEPLTISATLDAETRAGASYSLTVNDDPAGRIVMGRHGFTDAPDTLFRNRFACLSSTFA
jgi:hypothetical protein